MAEYSFRSENIWSDQKHQVNKMWKHDITEKQISKSKSFRCVNPNAEFQSNPRIAGRQFVERRYGEVVENIMSDKERAMNDVWKHDMFEITEREIAESKKNNRPAGLFLTNLDHNITEADIIDLFSVVGKLQKVSLHYDRSGRSLGTATVLFERTVDAHKSIQKYDGKQLDGKTIKIELLSSTSSKRSRHVRTIQHYKKDDRVFLSGTEKHVTRGTLPRYEDFRSLTGYFNNLHIK